MENVPHRETLRARLGRCGTSERRELLARLRAEVSRLHAAGWFHRDLYLQHFVLSPRPAREGGGERMVLLDVGRARRERRPARRWFVKDLAALLHSCPAAVTNAERVRFLRDWLAARDEDERASRRSWSRSILTKARRLAAHEPRHFDPEPSEPS